MNMVLAGLSRCTRFALAEVARIVIVQQVVVARLAARIDVEAT